MLAASFVGATVLTPFAFGCVGQELYGVSYPQPAEDAGPTEDAGDAGPSNDTNDSQDVSPTADAGDAGQSNDTSDSPDVSDD